MLREIFSFFGFAPVFLFAAAVTAQSTAKPIAIPLKPDPPLTIDGDLGDWNMVPGTHELNTRDQVAKGGGQWQGAQDLSAVVRLAWRRETLYIAAEVRDQTLQQSGRGKDLGKGDHLSLFLDTVPGKEPGNDAFGPRQFQIALSPGNLTATDGTLANIPPEAHCYLPAGASAKGTQVAAQRTAGGYVIEASIPWTVFQWQPQAGAPLALEVVLVDTDSPGVSRGKIMTIGATGWKPQRRKLLAAVLAEADGSAAPPEVSTPVFETVSLEEAETETVVFDAPATPEGYEALLSLQARLHTPKTAGYTQAMKVTLNGKVFDIKRIVNKSNNETMPSGKAINTAAGVNFTVPYAPDFDATDTSPSYALQDAKASLFEFRVTDLLEPSGNQLTIENTERPGIERTLVLGNASLLYRVPSIAKARSGPPSGKLPMISPQPVQAVPYQVDKDGDHMLLRFHGNSYKIRSHYSTPDGKWVSASNKYFTVKRQIEKKGEWMVVRETFTNLTDKNLPLMHRGEVDMKPDKVWLGGLSPNRIEGTSSNPHNPTVFGVQGETGIGLLPLDDVFQVHITAYSSGDGIGLKDRHLVLKPATTYTAEWAIVPLASQDHFDFINATRRLLDTNFEFDGSFAFLRAHPRLVGKWSDQKLVDFANFKDAKYLCLNIGYPYYKGRIPQGTALQQIDHSTWREAIARRRRLLPDAKQLAYFHSFIDVTDGAPEKYEDSRILRADGEQADYGRPIYKLFLPTLSNSYGPAIAKNIDLILDQMELDGVYWDEIDRSRYSYDHNPGHWDGVSADIDPSTMRITRLKSSVTLLSQPWRLEQARRIMENHLLIVNGGNPSTRTMRDLHYIAFNETGSISNCVNSQLFTPIALGDHLTERSEEDAYRVMLNALDYGCVYYWYNDVNVVPTHHTLTRYMFPFTPVELHEGYVIGKNRILSNRSGIFGWGESGKHEVHVFDHRGREVKLEEIKAPTVVKTYQQDGKTWTEIRIGEGWSAAILRK